MRRQSKPQGLAARWPVRPLDVDPFHLPARYALPVCSAAGGQADRQAGGQDNILITRDRVAVERTAAGARLEATSCEVGEFEGVAIRIDRAGEGAQAFVISVNLHHDEPDLCLPLHVAFDMYDVGARWQSWGRALALPLLLPSPDGGWREPDETPGRLFTRAPSPRHPRLLLAGRRSRMSAVREVGRLDQSTVFAGAEIIARN